MTEVTTDITDTPDRTGCHGAHTEDSLLGYLQCVRMLSAVFPPPLAVMAADVGGNVSEF